jgi:hypothetical protein
VVWIDASWSGERRALTLRLRGTSEIVQTLQERSRDLGRRAVSGARDRLPEVAAPPARRDDGRRGAPARANERITAEEQARLDRLIAEKATESQTR